MSMDVNILRETITVMSFITFIAIVAYAAFPGNEARFRDAARVPLDDDEPIGPSPQPSPKGEGANV
jgi:cbb3-type cytochrome oxidase subunit 3